MKSVHGPSVAASRSREGGEWPGESAGEAGEWYSCGASVGQLTTGRAVAGRIRRDHFGDESRAAAFNVT
jgi:hypothetical protein